MSPYIFGKRSLIHIVDVRETMKGLLRAKHLVAQIVAGGKDILLVGTKRQARSAVETVALENDMHYVNDRWLGGTLTNFRTIRSRLARLEQLEKMSDDGTLEAASKKQGATFRRELRKIRRNLQGIRRMERLPGALVLIDEKREAIAIKEARKLGIPTICLLDTDSNPDMVDLPIPGNDDAMRAIELIIGEIGKAIALGRASRVERTEREATTEEEPRRRSSRQVMGSAEGDMTHEALAAEAAATAVGDTPAAPAPAPAAPATAPAAPAPAPAAPAPAPAAPAPAPAAPAPAPAAPAPAPAAPAPAPAAPAPAPAAPAPAPAPAAPDPAPAAPTDEPPAE